MSDFTKNILVLWIYSFFMIVIFNGRVCAAPSPDVARLSMVQGVVSFLPVGETTWVNTTLNRPLISGDGLWVDVDSRAELQMRAAAARLGNKTNIAILNFDSKINQYKLPIGSFILSIRQQDAQPTYEIDTPNLALSITQPGYYRIDVTSDATIIAIRQGQATVYGKTNTMLMKSGQNCRFMFMDLQDHQCSNVGPLDALDQWSMARDDSVKKVVSTQHVSPMTIGFEDLSTSGQWRQDSQYGQIWLPDDVDENWAPYQSGQWVWLRYWGWTWVDAHAWGFAPFHYGRWAFVAQRWAWVPGPIAQVPFYAPALVAFTYPLAMAAVTPWIGWFPLGPGEFYRPPYNINRNYFNQINISNTIINPSYLNRMYDNHNVRAMNYQNAHQRHAVSAMSSADFLNSKRVGQERVPDSAFASAPKSFSAPFNPDSASVLGNRPAAKTRPSDDLANRFVVTKNPLSAKNGQIQSAKSLVKSQPVARPKKAARSSPVKNRRRANTAARHRSAAPRPRAQRQMQPRSRARSVSRAR